MILTLLFLLFFKHWFIDFVNQTAEEVVSKGKYGELVGMNHSIKHGFATMLIVAFFFNIYISFFVGLIEAIVHYHIDWYKSNYGCSDIREKIFWSHLGFDQFLHYVTYLIIAAILF